jgi:hypothetical protein
MGHSSATRATRNTVTNHRGTVDIVDGDLHVLAVEEIHPEKYKLTHSCFLPPSQAKCLCVAELWIPIGWVVSMGYLHYSIISGAA